MKDIILIALAGILLIALLALIAIFPALYRREARRQEEQA